MAVTTLQCFLVHLNAFHRICLVYCGLLSCPEKGVLGFLLTLDSVEVHVVFVLQSLSCVQLFAIPQTAARQASLFFTISQSLLKLMSVELVMPSTILSSVARFLACPQSFSASGSFPKSQLFASGGHIIGASVSASVVPVNIQGDFL